MRRVAVAFLGVCLLGGGLLLAGPAMSYSDGISGASGQIDEHLRTCKGTEYCTVTPSYCGGCHGSYDDMWEQEGAASTPQERVNKLTFKINGDASAGTPRGRWDYVPGETFSIEIQLANERLAGRYNQGGFNLNASAGTLSKWTPDDETVRITGGLFRHAGSKNPEKLGPDGGPYGSVEEDEGRHAGEATHTAKGAETRLWRVKWTTPAATPPRGAALVMTAMLPDGNDGIDTCTYRNCDPAQGYAPQSEWDWFGFMVPRRILCERGAYATFQECSKAVYDYILPPAPPVNTSTCGPQNLEECEKEGDDNGGDSPSLDGLLVLAGLASAAFAWHRRRP